jgi:hypothetical protein
MYFANSVEPLKGKLQQAMDGDLIHWSNGATWLRQKVIEPCESPKDCPELIGLDNGIDMLITEEGWGLSSANWMVRDGD